MARHDALYQRALYYDVALRRDIGAEVDFIRNVFRSTRAGSSIPSLSWAAARGTMPGRLRSAAYVRTGWTSARP